MTDKEKLTKIAEIINGGSKTANILENVAKSIKEKLGFTVELNPDGTINKAWWGEKPTRAKKGTKTDAKTDDKPEEKK